MFEAVAEGGQLVGAFGGEPLLGYFGGLAEAYDGGYVFGSGAALALVGAAVHHWVQADVAADEEDTDALGRVHLVAGDGEEVDVLERAVGAEVERDLACGLDGIGVEERTGGVSDGGECGDGLDDAGLVVRVHDADEFGVGADGADEFGRLDDALRGAGEEGDVDVAVLERLGGVEDGVVLDAGGDDVGALFGGGELGGDGAEEGEVVALGAAGGEDDLGGAAVEQAGDGVAGVIDGGAGVLAVLVDGAGVAEVLDPEWAHGLEDLWQQRRGRVCVHVDAVHDFILPVCVTNDGASEGRSLIGWAGYTVFENDRSVRR